jgi:predicted NBD/HSP70 family sugar kinase
VIVAARRGDAPAIAALEETGRYLGMGIASIRKAVDPGVIIVGGRLCAAWDLVAPGLLGTLRAHMFAGARETMIVLPTSLAVRPSLLGAAAIVQRKIFGDVRVTV